MGYQNKTIGQIFKIGAAYLFILCLSWPAEAAIGKKDFGFPIVPPKEVDESQIGRGELPAVSKTKIVYQDDRMGTPDIYLYDVGPDGRFSTADDLPEAPLAAASASEDHPSISANKIVYRLGQNGNYHVYLYDLGADGLWDTEDDVQNIPIATNTGWQVWPVIDGSKIVWNAGGTLYLYDLGPDGLTNSTDDIEANTIGACDAYQIKPSISENKIVWERSRNIYFYDLGPDGLLGTSDDTPAAAVTSDSAVNTHPSISQNKIVWESEGSIELYDLGPDGILETEDDVVQTTFPKIGSEYASKPVIFENKVVWQAIEGGGSNLYLYDLGPDGRLGTSDDSPLSEVSLTGAAQASFRNQPAMDADKIVYGIAETASAYLMDLNLAPVLNPIGAKAVYQGETITFEISGSDPDGDKVSFSADDIVSGVGELIDQGNGTAVFTWDPSAVESGDYHVTFRITDAVLTDEEAVTISVILPQQAYKEIFVGYGKNPKIDGTKIVYQDTYNNNTDIFLYDLGENGIVDPLSDYEEEEFQVTDGGAAAQTAPSISGNKIVWEAGSASANSVLIYDMGADNRFDSNDDNGQNTVAENLLTSACPVVSGNKITYRDYRSGSNVFLYDLGPNGIFDPQSDSDEGEHALTTNAAVLGGAEIHNNKIVYANVKNGYDIFMYDLGTNGRFDGADADTQESEVQITDNLSNQDHPAVYGSKIVYSDLRNGHYDVYLYDLGSNETFEGVAQDPEEGEFRMTDDTSAQDQPSVFGSKIAWRDNRNGRPEIFMYDLGPNGKFENGAGDDKKDVRLTDDPATGVRANPQIRNNRVVYDVFQDGAYEVYMLDVNETPVLNSVGSQSIYLGQTLAFILSAFDQDNDEITYSAADSSLPPDASLDSKTGVFSWAPVSLGHIGKFTVTFLAKDPAGASDSETISITTSNPAPVLAPIGNKTAYYGRLLSFKLSASDPNAKSLLYAAMGLPSGARLDRLSGKFTFRPSRSQQGQSFTVTFIVYDEYGFSDTETVTIKVAPGKNKRQVEQR